MPKVKKIRRRRVNGRLERVKRPDSAANAKPDKALLLHGAYSKRLSDISRRLDKRCPDGKEEDRIYRRLKRRFGGKQITPELDLICRALARADTILRIGRNQAVAAQSVGDRISLSGPVEALIKVTTTLEGLLSHPLVAGATPSWAADEHATREYAERTLRDVEIFRTGVHNSDRYTLQDLDDMVQAFRELDFRPAVKLGHDDSQGAPAYGWVTNVRRAGDKLLAEFRHVDEDVYDKITRQQLDRVSPEIFFNLNRNGKKYPRALKAVALLGAQVPAVAGLKPLHKSLSDGNELAIYSAIPLTFAVDSVGLEVDERVRQFMETHPEVTSYTQAMDTVLKEDRTLWEAYAFDAPGLRSIVTAREDVPPEHGPQFARYGAGMEIFRLMQEERDRDPRLEWGDALRIVIQKHPALAELYRTGHADPGVGPVNMGSLGV